MKYLYFILFSAMTFLCCSEESNHDNMEEKQITITGTAYNGKGGALVQTESGETYYIGGLDYWEDDILEKQVEVNGFIQTETFKEEDLKDETGAWKQGMVGNKTTVLKAKWTVVD